MLPEIAAAGASLATLSPQLPEFVLPWRDEDGIAFPLVLDLGLAVARSFGLTFALPDYLRELYLGMGIDLPRFNGDESWELPLPATFVIARDGSIVYVSADPDYTVRPEPDEVLAAIPVD